MERSWGVTISALIIAAASLTVFSPSFNSAAFRMLRYVSNQLHLEWHSDMFWNQFSCNQKTKCKSAFLSNGYSINMPSGDSQGKIICGSAGEKGVWKSRGRLELIVKDNFWNQFSCNHKTKHTPAFMRCPLGHTFWELLRRDYPLICLEKSRLGVRNVSGLVFKHIFLK